MIVTCIPKSSSFRFLAPKDANFGFMLSRFAYIRRDQNDIQIDSSTGLGKLIIHEPTVLALVAQLVRPNLIENLYPIASNLEAQHVDLLIRMFWSSGILTMCDAQGEPQEDQQHNLRQWEFHDLLFHQLSRGGFHRNKYGATQRFAGIISQPPKLKYYPADVERVALPLPEPEEIQRNDKPLNMVFEQRHSIRNPNPKKPLTLAQLSLFLYRSARVRQPPLLQTRLAGCTPNPEPMCYPRPYPSGGARYELELYLSIHRCLDLEPGLYHYQPLEHMLAKIRPYDDLVESLLEFAARSSAASEMPDVLITLGACFQRMAWRYQSMAYAAILKDVGVLYQTMYLVATAMNLAPCALGYGNSTLFAAAAGTDYYIESSVGEFMLSGGAGKPVSDDRP